ncbi:MAG: HAMP domain-containing protein [Hyphomicrobiales bacterium]|nr:HAMP domain-containing protein [Hyphomicrobiales bacterium]
MNVENSTSGVSAAPDAQVSAARKGDAGSRNASAFGIKAQLSATFFALALLTAIACAIAWFVFNRIEKAVTDITVKSIPEITLALKVAEVSADITTSAPAIMASETQEQRGQQKQVIDDAGNDLSELINQWNERGIAPAIAARISDSASKITAQIAIVDLAVENKLALEALLREKAGSLSQAHGHFLETLEPQIDDAVFNLVIDSESSNEATIRALKTAIARGTSGLNLLLTVRSNGNLIVSLLRDAAEHGEVAAGNPVVDTLGRVRSQFQQDLDALAADENRDGVRTEGHGILSLARNKAAFNAGSSDGAAVREKLAALNAAHDAFLDLIDPVIIDARAKIVSDIEAIADQQADETTQMIDTGSFKLLHLMSLQAEGNQAAGLLNEVTGVVDVARLPSLLERFDTAAGQMDRAFDLMKETAKLTPLRLSVDAQLDLGRGNENLFLIKQAQLEEIETAHAALEKSRALAVELRAAVAEFVIIAERFSDETGGTAQDTIDSGKIVMLLISAASIVGAILTMLLFVGPRLLRPIEETTQTMAKLAAGDTSVGIPGRERRDEIGRMAEALGVFRDITIEVQESNLREIETARRRLSDAIESISEAFSLYDGDDRLIVSNQKYGTLVHPEIAEEIAPGQTFEEILQLALDTGFIEAAVGGEEEWKRERLEKHNNPGAPHIMQRTDGVWILVSERRTAEGGVVAVYSDITKMKERENELAEKSQALEQLSSQLSKYLSPQVYQSIFTGEQAAVVASKRKKLTVFFSDLAGFTEVADRLESEDLSGLLNEYLTEMSKIALSYGATIDKYVGDAIMIFFGDPVSNGVKPDALNCVRMAMEMQKRLGELSASWSDYVLVEPLQCRIGIATGFCTVGNFGSEDRMDYTIIGGVVNLASRLENMADPGRILISAETYNLIHNEISCQEHETVKVKGLAYPVKTYLIGDDDGQTGEQGGHIAVLEGKLSVDMDLDAMSGKDREEASRMLQELAEKLSKTKG